MPRRPRLSTGGIAYHVLNRRVGRLELFEKPADYSAFEKILSEAHRRTGIRIAAYCLMPNHWHLLLWPRTEGATRHTMAGAHEKDLALQDQYTVKFLTYWFDETRSMMRVTIVVFVSRSEGFGFRGASRYPTS